MTERWLRELERIDSMEPSPGLLDRAKAGPGVDVHPVRGGNRAAVLVLALLVAGGGVGAALFELRGLGGRSSVGRLVTPPVVRIPVDNGARQVVFGDGSAWILTLGGVRRVDPTTNRVGELMPVPRNVVGLAFGDGSVWVTRYPNVRSPSEIAGSVVRLDARTGATMSNIRVGRSPAGIAAAFGYIWVSNTADGTISKIDPRTDSVVETIPIGGDPPKLFAGGRVIASGFGSLWIANEYGDPSVIRMDPRSGKVLAVLPSSEAVAIADGAVWVIRYGSTPEGPQRVDPATNRFIGQAHESVIQPESITQGEGSTWIVQGFGPTPEWVREHRGLIGSSGGTERIYRIDPDTFELLTRPLVIGPSPDPLGPPAVAFGSVWIPTRQGLLRVDAQAGGRSQPPFFADARAVSAVLQAKGTCTRFVDVVEPPAILPGETVGTCTVAGAPVRIFAFADPDWLARALQRRPSPDEVIGTNWIVTASTQAAADQVHRVLGGELRG